MSCCTFFLSSQPSTAPFHFVAHLNAADGILSHMRMHHYLDEDASFDRNFDTS